jgi:hypothetical protein
MGKLRAFLTGFFLFASLCGAFAQGNQVTLGSQVNFGTIPTSPGTGTVSVGAKVTDPLSLFGAYGTFTFTVTGSWSGTIVPEVQSCDSAGTWSTLQVYPLNSTTGQSTITANGVFQGSAVGFCAARARGNTVATAAATVTIAATTIGGGASTNGGGGTVTANQGTSPWVDNVTQFGGANVVTGTGTGGAGIPRVTVSSDSFPTSQAVNIGQAGTYSQITIATGGVDQTLATPTNGFQISNPDPSESCNVSEGTAASSSTGDVLAANGGWVKSPDAYKPGIPHVMCATTGHKLAYRIW